MSNSWTNEVERAVSRWSRRAPDQPWVVAVSGGGDSVGLLRLLHQLRERLSLRLSVAHLDHQARGAESRADAEFVADLASSLGLPFDLGHWSPSRGAHFEADARIARYQWLTEVARGRGASFVAVGHTRDDQAETILHRIIRGTGVRGLSGIPAKRRLSGEPPTWLVRPLLNVSRLQIREYVESLGQEYREDQTNLDVRRTRARIRQDLLPRLATEYNPRVAEALVRLGSLAASSERQCDAEVRENSRQAIIDQSADRVVLRLETLRKLSLFSRAEVIRRVWRGVGWCEGGMSGRRWRRIALLARRPDTPSTDVGHGIALSSDREFVALSRHHGSPISGADLLDAAPIALEIPGAVRVSWASCRIETSLEPMRDAMGLEIIDLERASLPLFVRSPQKGDRFEPLGMSGTSQPLADFFRGRRVPATLRPRTPLVCDRDGIIWVVGHRIADRVKRTHSTVSLLGLRAIDDDSR
jgi:tRNA(Ile)-lysidine synthase